MHHAEENGGVDLGLDLVEYLDDEVAEAHGGLLVGLRGKQSLCQLYDLLRLADLKDLLVAQKDEVFQGGGPVKEEEHVLTFVDEVEQLREDAHNFLELLGVLLLVSLLQQSAEEV